VLAPELLGLLLITLALTLLVVEQYVFGYGNGELVEKIIVALVNYGLALVAHGYGLAW